MIPCIYSVVVLVIALFSLCVCILNNIIKIIKKKIFYMWGALEQILIKETLLFPSIFATVLSPVY